MPLYITVPEALLHICNAWEIPKMFLCRRQLIKDTVYLPSRKLHVYRPKKVSRMSSVRVLAHEWILDKDR